MRRTLALALLSPSLALANPPDAGDWIPTVAACEALRALRLPPDDPREVLCQWAAERCYVDGLCDIEPPSDPDEAEATE